MDHFLVGAGWSTWSHGYAGDVYYTQGRLSTTMTLPSDTQAFYFYAEPNPFGVFQFSATATDGSVVAGVGPIGIEGFAGAQYMGVYSTSGPALASITVTADVDFAVGEFGIFRGDPSGSVPEPSSMLLLGLGILGLAAWRRRV
jgi:hypothetical protein